MPICVRGMENHQCSIFWEIDPRTCLDWAILQDAIRLHQTRTFIFHQHYYGEKSRRVPQAYATRSTMTGCRILATTTIQVLREPWF
jgi:hypothetical protein